MNPSRNRGFTIKDARDLGRYYFAGGDDAGRDLESERAAAEREGWVTSGVPASARANVIRIGLEAEVGASGFSLRECLATVKRGRSAKSAREQYDALALGVARLRRWTTRAVIGEAIGRRRQTVANLERRGRVLLEKAEHETAAAAAARRKPCRRHAEFEPDCPACLRNAPEEAIEYSGPDQLRGRLVGGS